MARTLIRGSAAGPAFPQTGHLKIGGRIKRSDRIPRSIISRVSRNSIKEGKDKPSPHSARNLSIISGNHTLCASPAGMLASVCGNRPGLDTLGHDIPFTAVPSISCLVLPLSAGSALPGPYLARLLTNFPEGRFWTGHGDRPSSTSQFPLQH